MCFPEHRNQFISYVVKAAGFNQDYIRQAILSGEINEIVARSLPRSNVQVIAAWTPAISLASESRSFGDKWPRYLARCKHEELKIRSRPSTVILGSGANNVVGVHSWSHAVSDLVACLVIVIAKQLNDLSRCEAQHR